MLTIQELLLCAHQMGASDLHITVGVPPKCRVNGVLKSTSFGVLTQDMTYDLIMQMVPHHLLEVLKDKGQVDFSYSVRRQGRYRVNVFRQRDSYAAVLRIVGERIPTPEELGIPDSVIELAKRKRGLVLVTGPTGSGKSTTLASIIDIINTNYNTHIVTLEDPIEYLHNHKSSIINQREVGTDTCSFADSLRAVLREDPDVILVGEMRDLDTISIAITAAETGHLVFSTLHTIGAAATIDRVIDVFPPHQQQQIRIQLASVLESVISQQLVPTADGEGRVAAFEVMHANSAVRNLIREGKTHQIMSMIQTNKKGGMITMDDALFEMAKKGKISSDKAVSFAQDPISMEKKLF